MCGVNDRGSWCFQCVATCPNSSRKAGRSSKSSRTRSPATSTRGSSCPIRSCGTCSRCRWTSSVPGCSARLCRRSRHFDEPDRADEYLRALGRDHRKFAVEPEHYGMIKFALVEALREYAGDRWNLQYEQAWSDVYDLIAAKMIVGRERGRRAAVPVRRGAHARAPWLRRRRVHVPAAAAAELPGRPVRQHRDALPAPALAYVFDGERTSRGRHDRVPRQGDRCRLGVERARTPT